MARRTTASRKSTTYNRFSNVPGVALPRASFDRTKNHKLTCDASFIVPVYWEEIYPGDTVIMNPTLFGRIATLINPIMDNVWCDVFWFFTQNRILWTNWVKFMGEQENPGDSTDFTVPKVTVPNSSLTGGNLWDHLGLPTSPGGDLTVNALVPRAYRKIFHDWFRDQNLQNGTEPPVDDGPDSPGAYNNMLRRGKRHDYFTSSLPWPQKGDSVSVPIGQQALITYDHTVSDNTNLTVQGTDGMTRAQNASGTGNVRSLSAPASGTPLYADLTNATASTINQLRQAFQIQRLLERDARGGTRYPELLQSHFGVRDPSLAVHQRPIYLGGGTVPLNVTPIAQTSETSAGGNTPQANLSGMGTFGGQGIGFRGSFTEHGILMCLISIRADLTYQQGVRREFNRSTRYDYYWPVLSHLGEQSIENREIFADGSAADTDVFGYQERHAELRYSPNTLSGKFRSKASGTLDPWHLAQNFASRPVLNDSFIQDNAPVDRVISVQDEPQFIIDIRFNSRWVRAMPMYGVPGMIDHF